MRNRIYKLFERIPILKYILGSFVKWFVIIAFITGAVFGIMWFTGIYARAENMLDLKYNSPIILGLLILFAILAVLSFFIGFLLWIHKYKRPKSRSSFGRAVSGIWAILPGILISGVILLSGTAPKASAAEPDAVFVQEDPDNLIEGVDYLRNEPSGENGWYKSGEALEITPSGRFDQIREGETGGWKNELIKTEETSPSGAKVTFYLRNSVTNEISGPQTISYKLDHTAPGGGEAEPKTIRVTEEWDADGEYCQEEWEREYLGDVNGDGERNPDNYIYHVILRGEDTVSGVSCFTWKYKNDSNWSEPVPAVDGTAEIGVNYNLWQAGRGIDVRVYDTAGNRKAGTSVSPDRFLKVEYDRSHLQRYVDRGGKDISETDLDGSTRFIYNKETEVRLTVTADTFQESDISVNINDTPVNVKWSAAGSGYVGTVTLSEGNSVIRIEAGGYGILSGETGSKAVMGEYISNTHVVDRTDPVIDISFDGSSAAAGNLYTDDRSMTVRITDKNFRPDEISFSRLSAVDFQGNAVSNFQADDFLNALKSASWKTEGDVHSAVIVFSVDAYYEFTLEYSDLANNSAAPCQGVPFGIDKNGPSGLRIVYESNAAGMAGGTVSFGYYNPSVTVRIYAEDIITGIDHFNWTYTPEEGASTTLDAGTISGQIDCTDSGHFFYEDNGRTAVGEFTLTADESVQYRGKLSFTATDKAGHISSVHYGNGAARDKDGNLQDTGSEYVVVLDTVAPLCQVTCPEPQKTIEEDAGSIIYYNDTCGDIIPITVKITEANFYGEDVVVKLNDSDYTVEDWTRDGDEWTGTIQMTEDGTYIIKISYTDRSGNKMPDYQSERIVIDRAAPRIDRYEFTPDTADNNSDASDFVEALEYGYYFKTEFTVNIYTSDSTPSSGLDRIEYRLVSYENGAIQGEVTDSLPVVNGMAGLIVPAGFKGQIFARSCDTAGNCSGEVTPKAFVVDKTAPVIEIVNDNATEYRDGEGNPLYVNDVNIIVTILDYVSGIRRIGYAQSSENASWDRKEIVLENAGYQVNDDLGDGWIVSQTDANLVTKITKQFSFSSDDNHVVLAFDAADNSGNAIEGVTGGPFTIDMTAPVIHIAFREDDDTDIYYNEDRVADITVIERNFDPSRIHVIMENLFGGLPEVSFTEVSNTEHRAVIVFDEGDYTFEVNGADLGGHAAEVSYSGGNEHLFHVDKTSPVVTDNFAEFTREEAKNSFNTEKYVNISVMEHNFDPDLMQLRIFRKEAGSNHDTAELRDVTAEMMGHADWVHSGDMHTMAFTISEDAVYRIEMTPADLAGNASDYRSTAVFEIDQTAPVIVSRNGRYVGDDEVAFFDLYTYLRRDDPAPAIEFGDANMDYIAYDLTVWIPDRSNPEVLVAVSPEKVYLEEDPDRTGIISGGSFTLSDFTEDGVYALELTAVDEAGNESRRNVNTYARLVEQDVLAYILESNEEEKTGLYSFQYENGTPISMRPDSFSDLNIFAIAREDSDLEVVLRDTNAEEIPVDAQITADHSVYGVVIYNIALESEFFKNTFSGDTDAELYLAVKNAGDRIDLGKIHIDNVAPACEVPESFRSWHWYPGDKMRTITISNISEVLDGERTKVYDNGREIAFQYSGESNTLSFEIEEGWHDIGVVICDMAGNKNIIQERTNIYVGYFWLWVIIAGITLCAGAAVLAVVRGRGKR